MDFETALQILNNTAGVLALFVSVLAYGLQRDEIKKNILQDPEFFKNISFSSMYNARLSSAHQF